MATYFVVSDVHSFYNEMMYALVKSGFDKDNKNHIFVSLGDLLDRGPDAVKCLEFVNSLPAERKILIKGNHERLMQQAIYRGYFMQHDYHNGTVDTAVQLTSSNNSNIFELMFVNSLWNTYYDSLIDYYENDKYVFVHGWIPCELQYEGKNLFGDAISYYEEFEDWRFGKWDDACWLNGMDCWAEGVRVEGKTILCGHFHSSWGHHFLHHEGVAMPKDIDDILNWNVKPFIDDGIICLDACTVISGVVNCMKLTKQRKFDKQWRKKYS